MNVTGPVVLAALKSYGVKPVDSSFIVVHDDLETPFGKVRLRLGGSAKCVHRGLVRLCLFSYLCVI